MTPSHRPPLEFYDTQFALETLRAKVLGEEHGSTPVSKGRRIASRRDVVSFLALAMERRPGDDAAAFLQIRSDDIILHVSKKNFDVDDQEHADQLIEITKKFGNSNVSHEFEMKLLQQIIKKCPQKLKQAVEILMDAELAKAHMIVAEWVAEKTRSNTLHEWIATAEEASCGARRSRSTDKHILSSTKDNILGAVLGNFEVIELCIKWVFDSPKMLFNVSTCCHELESSMVWRTVLEAALKPEQFKKLMQGLVPLGKYSRGCTILKDGVGRSFRRGLPRISSCLVQSQEETHCWYSSAYSVVARVWLKDHPTYKRVPAKTESRLRMVVRDLEWGQSFRFTRHPEMELLMHLRNLGFKSGKIGVSGACCGACWLSITTLNSQEKQHWSVSAHKGRLCCTLHTGIQAIDQVLLDKIESTLQKYIKHARAVNRRDRKSAGDLSSDPASERSEPTSADSVAPPDANLHTLPQANLPDPPAVSESPALASRPGVSRTRPLQSLRRSARILAMNAPGGFQGARGGGRS